MRDTTRKLSHGLQLVRLTQLFLEQTLLGDVPADREHQALARNVDVRARELDEHAGSILRRDFDGRSADGARRDGFIVCPRVFVLLAGGGKLTDVPTDQLRLRTAGDLDPPMIHLPDDAVRAEHGDIVARVLQQRAVTLL